MISLDIYPMRNIESEDQLSHSDTQIQIYLKRHKVLPMAIVNNLYYDSF